MFISHRHVAGQNSNIRKCGKDKNVTEMLTDQNCIDKVIKASLNYRNACYREVQNSVIGQGPQFKSRTWQQEDKTINWLSGN